MRQCGPHVRLRQYVYSVVEAAVAVSRRKRRLVLCPLALLEGTPRKTFHLCLYESWFTLTGGDVIQFAPGFYPCQTRVGLEEAERFLAMACAIDLLSLDVFASFATSSLVLQQPVIKRTQRLQLVVALGRG